MDRYSWRIICLVIVFSPIALSAPSPLLLSFDILCLSAGLYTIMSHRRFVNKPVILCLTMPFLFIGAYLALQVIPLSSNLLKLFAPETWQSYKESVWQILYFTPMPLSIHFEATIRALVHISALWILCVSLSLLINNHWRLLELVRAFALATSIWSILIILIVMADNFGLKVLFPEVSQYLAEQTLFSQNLKTNLAIWNVLYLPLMLSGYRACRTHSTRRSFSGQIKSFLKEPETMPHFTLGISTSLILISLLIMFDPVLWLACLSGYFLYLSFKPVRDDSDRFINKRILRIASFLCVLGLVVAIKLLPSFPLFSASIVIADLPLLDFAWLGNGMGTHQDVVGVTVFTGENAHPARWSSLAQIWSGLGHIGTVLLIIAILLIYLGAGGRKSVNPSDHICSNLFHGGLASLVLLLVFSSLVSFWEWQSMLVSCIYLVFLITWCRKLSHSSREGEVLQVHAWLTWCLYTLTGFMLTVSSVFVLLNLGNRMVVDPWFELSNDGARDWQKVNNVMVLFLNTVSKFAPLGSDYALTQGHHYLFQNRDDDAEKIILQALKMRPLSAEVHVAVASVSACIGNESAAMHFLSTDAVKKYVPDITTERIITRLMSLPNSGAAVKLIYLALEHSPHMAGRYISLMRLYGYEPLAMQALLPEHPRILRALGDLLVSEGYDDAAENIYWKAVFNKSRPLDRDAELYMHIANHFAASSRISEALVIANEGAKHFPDSGRLADMSAYLQTQLGR